MAPAQPAAPAEALQSENMVPSAEAADVTPATQLDPDTRLRRITERAYEIYERRGGEPGREADDWLQAEREIDGGS